MKPRPNAVPFGRGHSLCASVVLVLFNVVHGMNNRRNESIEMEQKRVEMLSRIEKSNKFLEEVYRKSELVVATKEFEDQKSVSNYFKSNMLNKLHNGKLKGVIEAIYGNEVKAQIHYIADYKIDLKNISIKTDDEGTVKKFSDLTEALNVEEGFINSVADRIKKL